MIASWQTNAAASIVVGCPVIAGLASILGARVGTWWSQHRPTRRPFAHDPEGEE